MKNLLIMWFVLIGVSVLFSARDSYACCMDSLIFVPETIGENSFLNTLVSVPFKDCQPGVVDIAIEDGGSPITVEREKIWTGGGPVVVVRLKKDGGWGKNSPLKIPLKAICADGVYINDAVKNHDQEYVYVNVSKTPVFEVNERRIPEIRNITKQIEKTASSQYYTGKYTVTLVFEVEPVCPECVYKLYLYEKDREKFYIKRKEFNTMLGADKKIYLKVNQDSTADNCFLYYDISNENLCNGLMFRVQIEDSYGNLSYISEEKEFMPPQEHINKYCISDGGMVDGDSMDYEEPIDGMCGMCSILLLN